MIPTAASLAAIQSGTTSADDPLGLIITETLRAIPLYMSSKYGLFNSQPTAGNMSGSDVLNAQYVNYVLNCICIDQVFSNPISGVYTKFQPYIGTMIDFTEQTAAINYMLPHVSRAGLLALIGDLSVYNITTANNPAVTVPDYEVANLAAPYDLPTAANNANLPTTTMYLQGEPDATKRIQQFFRIFLFRVWLGDTLPHAFKIAVLYTQMFRVASMSMRSTEWLGLEHNVLCPIIPESQTYLAWKSGDLSTVSWHIAPSTEEASFVSQGLSYIAIEQAPSVGAVAAQGMAPEDDVGAAVDPNDMSFLTNAEQLIFSQVNGAFLTCVTKFMKQYFPQLTLLDDFSETLMPVSDGTLTTTSISPWWLAAGAAWGLVAWEEYKTKK